MGVHRVGVGCITGGSPFVHLPPKAVPTMTIRPFRVWVDKRLTSRLATIAPETLVSGCRRRRESALCRTAAGINLIQASPQIILNDRLSPAADASLKPMSTHAFRIKLVVNLRKT
jgi:hypothetical protein